MKEKQPLFKKSMDELREAFVKARFAQEDVFGRADIEEWLKSQREAKKPEYVQGLLSDGESYWNTVLAHRLYGRTIQDPYAVLRDSATYFSSMPPSNKHPLLGSQNQFATFIRILGCGCSSVGSLHYGHCHGLIIRMIPVGSFKGSLFSCTMCLEEGGEHERLVIEPLDVNSIKTSIFIFDALFADWLDSRPRWKEARQYLCDSLANEIFKERAKAEADFNRAVAVSEDGTKIVCADWVIICQKPNTNHRSPSISATIFPGTFFQTQKIRLDEPRSQRFSVCWAGDLQAENLPSYFRYSIERFVNSCDGHAVVENKYNGGSGIILLVKPSSCPDPLPEGGVELKV